MQRQKDRKKIYDFMIKNGVDKFWANSALKHIMLNFAGNTYWITKTHSPKVIVDEFGMINKFTICCTINTVSNSVYGKLTYTFVSSHKVQIRPISKYSNK